MVETPDPMEIPMPLTKTLVAATAALSLALPAAASGSATFTGDGGHVPVFTSPFALAAGDVDRSADLYVRAGGATRLLSDGTAGTTAELMHASDDGAIAYFSVDDVLHVRTPTEIKRVSTAEVALRGVTPDGGKAFLNTYAPLVAEDTDALTDVYEYTTATGALRLLTIDTTAENAVFRAANPSGTMVYYSTVEQVTSSDKDASLDVYLTNGKGTVKVTPGDGAHDAFPEALADTDNRLVFKTAEALVAADTDTKSDLYSTTGVAPTLLTTSTNPAADAQPVTFVAASRADAHRVLFTTTEKLAAADTDAAKDLYAAEGGKVYLVTPGVAAFHVDDVSADAETVLFSTNSKMLPSDTDGSVDMYSSGDGGPVHLLKTNQAFGQSGGRLSPDGSVIAFNTAEVADPADTDALTDVYVMTDGDAQLASPGSTEKDASLAYVLSSGEVVFNTDERLLAADRNAVTDVYGFTGATLTMISADTFAPDTRMATADGARTLETDEEATFECRVDGAEWAACAAPWAVGPLAPGEHLLEARAVDVAGNADPTPASETVTVAPGTVEPPKVGNADSVAPAVSAAKLRIRRRAPRLTFTLSEAASVRVKVQRRVGKRFKTLRTVTIAGRAGANRKALGKLPRRGTFRVVLTATDAAGNASTKLVLRPSRR